MNLMDDMLVLPQSSSGMTETSYVDPAFESPTISSTGITVIKYPGSKVISYQANSSEDVSNFGLDVPVEVIPSDEESSKDVASYSREINEDVSDFVQSQNKLASVDTVPEPQVIVIPSDPIDQVNRIVVPKDPYRAKLEQAFEKKGRSMVFGPSTGKVKTRKLIISPTHQHASKKETQKAKMVSHAEKIKLKDSLTTKNLLKPAVTSVLYPWNDRGIHAGQIIHTPEKQKYTLPFRRDSTPVDLHCNEDMLAPGDNILGTAYSSVHTVPANTGKAPHVKVIYIKAKQNTANEDDDHLYKRNSAGIDSAVNSDQTMLKLNDRLKTLQNVAKSEDTSEYSKTEHSNGEISNNEQTNSSACCSDVILGDTGISDKQLGLIVDKPLGSTIDKLLGSAVDKPSVSPADEDVKESGDLPMEQKIANSLCQVIELKQQPQTAIEYVLLNNKMVPISKPYAHGRVSAARQIFQRLTPGRVDVNSQKRQSVGEFTELPGRIVPYRFTVLF